MHKDLRTVLIVEDDHLMQALYRDWICELLKPSSSVLVQFADNGKDAERLLKTHMYSMTLLDLALPYISGAELIDRYRANMGNLVVASSFAEFYGKMKSNVDSVLQKPLSMASVGTALKNFLRSDIYADTRADHNSQEHQSI